MEIKLIFRRYCYAPVVYRINLNGKCYIGCTRNFHRRMLQHEKAINVALNTEGKLPAKISFYSNIVDHLKKTPHLTEFSVDILEWSEERNRYHLRDLEKKWLRQLGDGSVLNVTMPQPLSEEEYYATIIRLKLQNDFGTYQQYLQNSSWH